MAECCISRILFFAFLLLFKLTVAGQRGHLERFVRASCRLQSVIGVSCSVVTRVDFRDGRTLNMSPAGGTVTAILHQWISAFVLTYRCSWGAFSLADSKASWALAQLRCVSTRASRKPSAPAVRPETQLVLLEAFSWSAIFLVRGRGRPAGERP